MSPLNYYSAQSTLSRSPWRDIDGGGQYTNCPLEQRPRGGHSRRRGRRGLNHEPQRDYTGTCKMKRYVLSTSGVAKVHLFGVGLLDGEFTGCRFGNVTVPAEATNTQSVFRI
eukprot:scaffold290722_cov70-Cyclotella_meneghiniana.AAC.1